MAPKRKSRHQKSATQMDTDDQENSSSGSSQRRSDQDRKSAYRILLNKIEEIDESGFLDFNTVTEVGTVLREANQINSEVDIEDRVDQANETLLDCMVVSSASRILVKCIETVDVFATGYEAKEFASKIVSYLNTQEEDPDYLDYSALLDEARKVIPAVPHYKYIYGTYDLNNLPQPKQKVERPKVVKEQLTKKAPEKLTTVDNDEESIEKITKKLNEVLCQASAKNNGRPVNYYDYVIDTSSFAATIENMFFCSFLVRNGKARIELASNGTPVIKPVSSRELNQFREQGNQNAQVISTISMDVWKTFRKEGLIQQSKRKNSN